jgi:hypothetical protein
VLVGGEDGRTLAARNLNGDDLVLELAGHLCGGEALLRTQCPPILCFSADLEFAYEIFGVPARVLVRKRVIEAVAQHAVIELPVAHTVAPAAARDQVGRQIHVLHASGHRGLDRARYDLVGCRHDRLHARAADAVNGHRRD